MTGKNDNEKWYSWGSAIGVGIFLASLGLFLYLGALALAVLRGW